MTRKHFEALAEALRFAHPIQGANIDTSEARTVWQAAQNNVADACSRFNGAFDRSRFIEACTPTKFKRYPLTPRPPSSG